MKVVLLGSNPSNASPFSDPFTHSKSSATLDSWLKELGLSRSSVDIINVSDTKTPNNRPLKSDEITRELPRLGPLLTNRVVVALGKTAATAVSRLIALNVKSWKPAVVIELPHPSGLNRKLNDKEWLSSILQSARDTVSRYIDLPDR